VTAESKPYTGARRGNIIILGAAAVAIVLIVAYVASVFQSDTVKYDPVINPEDFVSQVDNPYYPLVRGTTFVYEGVSEDGNETNEVAVTNQTKVIMGVSCVVVWDRVWLEGALVEETFDWYAQDKNGSVWYFGEDSREIENGLVVSTEGSWQAGIDDAKPGIVMMGQPVVGEEYRQEYYRGEAEDMAEVLSLNASATVPFGTYSNCLQTKDWTPLEPGIAESKYYAPGIGLVMESALEGGTSYMYLVEIVAG
jgi:hypothetical protein